MPRRRYRRLLALLVAALLAAYLVGNNRPALWDRDEPRYAVTSLAMLQSGDWIVPRFLGEVRTAKPPAVYWLQAAAMAAVGVSDFAVRLPGALACAATIVVLGVGLPPVVGRRRALWTCFLLGTSVLVLGVAKVGVIDGPMLPCAASMQVALLRLSRRGGGSGVFAPVALWLSIGFAGLLKGPILLGVFLTTLLALFVLRRLPEARGDPNLMSRERSERDKRLPRSLRPRLDGADAGSLLRRTRPLLGIALLALIVGPWLLAVQLRAPDFLRTTVAHDLIARAAGGLEGHGRPPGFHLLCLAGTWFPWSVLLPGVLVHAWRRRRVGFVAVALAGCVGPWVMFELAATKLPHYLLPIFPMLALLTADWLVRARRGRVKIDRRGFFVAAAIFAAVALGFGVVPWVMGVGGWAASVVAVAWAVASGCAWTRPNLGRAVLTSGVGMAVTAAVAYATWLPRSEPFTRSKRVAAALADSGATAAILVDYKEPSLAWYAARHGVVVREADQEELDAAGGFAVVKRRPQEARSAATRRRWRVAAVVPFGGSGRGDVLLLRSAAADPPTGATR